MPQNQASDILNLKEALDTQSAKYDKSYEPFGMTLLTDPSYVSGNRCIMFTNHLKQFVSLKNPNYPKVSMGFENMVGEQSTGYKSVENDTQIFRRIPKFDQPGMQDFRYFDFVFDTKTKTYDVIDKKMAEDLTEKFGFMYNTDALDSYSEGDTIPAGTVYAKTNSYDEEMNYSYGQNALTMFALDPYIIEDAIRIRYGFAKQYLSIESETPEFSLNDNDIMRNYYGDEHEYKCFPDIGEHTKNKILTSIARIHKKQIAYTLKSDNICKPNFRSDLISYCDGTVIDLDIFCNKDIVDIPETSFNSQILKYLRMQERFYTRIVEVCEEIFDSGFEWSENINYIYDRATQILDPEVKFRNTHNDSEFSNMILKFHVIRDVDVKVGQKITARCGNKGVVSLIVPDEEMPYLENGRPMDLVYSSLGMPNRLITFPMYEQSITFICNRTIELKISQFTNLKDKEELWFDIVTRFNSDQGKHMKEYYYSLSNKEKIQWWKDVENYDYTIIDTPLWQTEESSLFDIIRQIYIDYPWIKPYKVFVNKWGRRVPILRDLVIGYMYVIKLKQTSKKNFSSRSTGGLNKKGLPAKTSKAKHHEALYSDTPVSHSDQELNNETIAIDPEITARQHLYMRSSKTGRRKTGEALGTLINGIEKFESSLEDTNLNVTILQAYLKSMGLTLRDEDDYMHIDTPDDSIGTYYTDDGDMFIGEQDEFTHHNNTCKAKRFMREDGAFVGSSEEYMKELKKIVDEMENED